MKKQTEERNIHISNFDLARLEELLDTVQHSGSRNNRHLEALAKELLRAEILEPRDIPPDVITMNSEIRLLDMDSKQELTYSLVFPAEADIEQNKISILAPVGTALIGYRIGDIIEWPVPSGKRRLKVKKIIYQPEAAGDYHL